jgi:hypothetical protein
MYALIYDERQLDQPQKKVLSVHTKRATAEKALDKRMKKLGRRVWECHTRIVWVKRRIKAGDLLNPAEFEVWRPGEPIPSGEMYPDTD